jgi:hypothetical protein
MKNVIIKEELITPKMAERMLLKNKKNRNANRKTIEFYSDLMKNGQWKRNTFELIKFSEAGDLLDGQHRLMAVVQSKTDTYFHVGYNVPNEVFDVLDTGKKRNASDVFNIQGVKNSNILPSIIRYYTNLSAKNIANQAVSNTEILELYQQNESYWQEVARFTANNYIKYSKLLTPQEMGGTFAYIFENDSKENAQGFIEDLVHGVNIRTNAISLLTKKLMDNKLSRVKNLPPTIKKALILKTYLLWKNSKDAKILKFTKDSETFPFLH